MVTFYEVTKDTNSNTIIFRDIQQSENKLKKKAINKEKPKIDVKESETWTQQKPLGRNKVLRKMVQLNCGFVFVFEHMHAYAIKFINHGQSGEHN